MNMAQTMNKAAAPDAVAQVRRAKGLYAWLWLSPFLTLPTLGVLTIIVAPHANPYSPYVYDARPTVPWVTVFLSGLAVLGSGLWHLVLLSRALDPRSEFVRWHGRQALLLAGVRTAVALVLAVILAAGAVGQTAFFGFVLLLALWFFGTLWAQGQAEAGECSLMRWAGLGAQLPLRVTTAMNAAHDAMAWGDTLQRQGRSAEAGLVFRQLLVSNATPAVMALAAARLPLPGQRPMSGQPVSSETADILVAMLRFSDDPARRRAALAALEQAGLVEAL